MTESRLSGAGWHQEPGVMLNALRFVSVVLTAVVMARAFAHLFELPNKINLPREAAPAWLQVRRRLLR